MMNTSPFAFDQKQKDLIEDSARWRLISMLLDCPVNGWCEALTALASEIPDPDLKEAASAAQTEASEALYHSLFGPGGPAPPREASHHKGVELGSLMSELTGYYEAFGYTPNSREAFDHVSVEADFAGYLRLKEAYAQVCQDSERGEITAEAARSFIQNHLSAIAGSLLNALEQSGIHYLVLAGRALDRNTRQGRR